MATARLPSQPQRILIFGGTFDPPHRAHVTLPAMAADLLECDLVIFVPTAISPLKSMQPTASSEHRLAMLLLAIADVPHAKISMIELDRASSAGKSGAPSYTIDTLRSLREEYAVSNDQPHKVASRHQGIKASRRATATVSATTANLVTPEFRLLIGCDQALDFHRWKDWQQILLLATPAVMLRPPWDDRSFRNALDEKYSKVEADSWMNWTLRLPMVNTSATEIRKRLSEGPRADLSDTLQPQVLDYIRANHLYEST